MSSERTIFGVAIAFVAAATLSVTGCKKQPTTAPGDDSAPVDADEDVEASDDALPQVDDPASEVEADDGAAALSKASFDETIHEHFEEVSDCYVAALGDNPELQGTLNAEFTIGAEGQVLGIVALDDSTLSDEALLTCISEAAAGWTFAIPAAGEMNLRYAYELAPA